MSTDPTPITSARPRRAEAILAAHPLAMVAAVEASGFIVPLPAMVPLTTQTVLQGHATALELVAPEHLKAVTLAWQDAHLHGASLAQVRAVGSDGGELCIQYVDVREEFGVFLCLIEGDITHLKQRRGQSGAMRPRVSTVRKDGQAVFAEVDDAIEAILGHDDLVGRRNLELVHPDDAPRAIANWMDMLASPGESRRVRLRQQHRDGRWVWFDITNHNRLHDPAQRCVIAEMIDVSDEMAAQEFVQAQERLLRTLTDSLPVGVAQADPEGRIVHRNPRLTEIVGDAASGTLAGLFAGVVADQMTEFAAASAGAFAGENRNLELELDRPDGSRVRCHLILRPLEDGQGVLVCVDDITDSARMRDQLHHRATRDQLTGCLNRASLLHELQNALRTTAEDNGIATIFIDLDGFKAVNDRQGHAAGDAHLQAIARCLVDTVRTGDLVGRFGGDEFVAVVRGADTPAKAIVLAERIAGALAAAVTPTEGRDAVASLGVAWASGADAARVTAEQLIGQADAAMYRSKAAGEGRPVLCAEAIAWSVNGAS